MKLFAEASSKQLALHDTADIKDPAVLLQDFPFPVRAEKEGEVEKRDLGEPGVAIINSLDVDTGAHL